MEVNMAIRANAWRRHCYSALMAQLKRQHDCCNANI